MTKKVTTPFRFRELASTTLITNELGDFGIFENSVVERLFSNTLSQDEEFRLSDLLVHFDEAQKWKLLSLARRLKRHVGQKKQKLSYILVIPTLRCDLSCSYCQVSRAPLHGKGFDWDEAKLFDFSNFLDGIGTDNVKIEFQGGEPTLRPDLIKDIINICENKCISPEFVICTNLVSIGKEMDEIYRKPNVCISTSVDGPEKIMVVNRTQSANWSKQVFKNLDYAIKEYGANKVSALPTITENMLKSPRSLINFYRSLGFNSIFLRPVNYMGFARKRFHELSKDIKKWNDFYREAMEYIVDLNEDCYFEELYFSLLLKRVFQCSSEGYVDFRSPNFYLNDYCVIDFDGKIYPSDEARMLSRSKHVDLSVGQMGGELQRDKVGQLNWHSMNQVEPDCVHCAYMPFCGVDLIDDLSRYNRMDSPKLDTWFCRRHIMIFDLIFEKIISHDVRWLDVFLKWIYHKQQPPKTYEIFYDKAEI